MYYYTVSQSLYTDDSCWIQDTIGVGSIFIRMHDGIVRELTFVRYVRDIRRNLLFVGALETNGYKIVIEARILKIYHRALIFLKGVRHQNLYNFKGKIVIGQLLLLMILLMPLNYGICG